MAMLSSPRTDAGAGGMARALDAVRRVWASKWNDRAVLSMRKAGQPHSAVQVLVISQCIPMQGYCGPRMATRRASMLWAGLVSNLHVAARPGFASCQQRVRPPQMAVLVQQLLPARYAFVSHTRNPVSGASPLSHLLSRYHVVGSMFPSEKCLPDN